MKIATMGRNYSDNSDSDDGPLRNPRGVAKGSVGEGAGMVISVGSVPADSSGSESVGILGHAKRTATPALLPVAVLSASAVLIVAFLAVASFRDSTAGHRDRHQYFQHKAERGANGGSTTVEGLGGRQLTLRALSPPAPLSSSLGDGGGRECPYVITEAKADVVIAATAAAVAAAETQVGEPAVPSSPFSSSSSSSSFWSSPASPPSVQRSAAETNNVLTVTNFNYSRLGNRFISLARNLGLGYCCKSRLVSLPPKDDTIAPGVFSEGVPGPRWFDFSSAPDVEGFNASTCPESITWGGQDAFYLTGVRDEDHPYYTPGLFECIKALPRVAGCEADYFFPADKVDVCLSDTPGLGYTLDEKRYQEEGPNDDGVKLYGVSGHDRKGDGLIPRVGGGPAVHGNAETVEEEGVEGKQRGGDASEGQWEQGRDERAREPTREGQMWQGEEEQGRGREEWGDDHDEGGHPGRRQLEVEASGTHDITLVVNHEGEGGAGEEQETERSGREVGEEGEAAGSLVVHVRSGDIFVDPAHPFYGQPPLEYYVRAMEHQRWDRIDVVTNGYQDENHVINPVVPALEAKVASGELAGDIHFHKNRTMGEDLLSMLCGDGFVAAKSTVRHLVSRHSSATRMYFPHACDDKLRDLGLERPGIKVFGMVWQEEDYTVYQRWNNSQEQLSEIVTFTVPGFEQCGDRKLDP